MLVSYVKWSPRSPGCITSFGTAPLLVSHKQPPLLFTFLMFTYERWVARGQILGTSREIKILGLRDISGNHTQLYALMRTAMT